MQEVKHQCKCFSTKFTMLHKIFIMIRDKTSVLTLRKQMQQVFFIIGWPIRIYGRPPIVSESCIYWADLQGINGIIEWPMRAGWQGFTTTDGTKDWDVGFARQATSSIIDCSIMAGWQDTDIIKQVHYAYQTASSKKVLRIRFNDSECSIRICDSRRLILQTNPLWLDDYRDYTNCIVKIGWKSIISKYQKHFPLAPSTLC